MLYNDIKKLSSKDLCFNIGLVIEKDIKTKKLKKQDVAREAGVTSMSLYRLCKGENCSLETLIKVLKTIERFDIIDLMLTPSKPDPLIYYSNLKKRKQNKSDKVKIEKEDLKKITEEDFEWKE